MNYSHFVLEKVYKSVSWFEIGILERKSLIWYWSRVLVDSRFYELLIINKKNNKTQILSIISKTYFNSFTEAYNL